MDALTAIVELLKPQTVGAKFIHGSGRWGVRYPAFEQPSFALVLNGSCWLAANGMAATTLETHDFVLFPAMPGFVLASDADVEPSPMNATTVEQQVEEIFHGEPAAKPSVRILGGNFAFDPINKSVLLDLLPKILRIRANNPAIGSVATVVQLIQSEARERRPGRSLVLTRLIEILLIEALRSVPEGIAETGLLAGLREPQLAAALRAIHTKTAHPWTLSTLAREAAMSRSLFAERFARVIGVTPGDYLLQWRLATAKRLLVREQKSVGEAALAVGYESASGFSTAFSREVGLSPKQFIEIHRGSAT